MAHAVYKKHYPPALVDDVWRLSKIGKDGAFHRKLAQHGIRTVQEFLRMLTVKPDALRAVSRHNISYPLGRFLSCLILIALFFCVIRYWATA